MKMAGRRLSGFGYCITLVICLKRVGLVALLLQTHNSPLFFYTPPLEILFGHVEVGHS